MVGKWADWLRPWRALWRYRRGLGELLLIVGVTLLYFGTRGVALGQEDVALANARDLIALERRFGLFHEPTFNAWVVTEPFVVRLLNAIYTYGHLPVLCAFALWAYLRRNEQYAVVRNAFLVSAALGLTCYALLPMAPPRLLPAYGFTDTLASYSNLSYEVHSIKLFYNPYAAMPSLHFGWSLLVGVGLCWLTRHPAWRAAGLALPALMFLAIIGTGNHFFLDAVGGAFAIGLGFVVGCWTRMIDSWRAWRGAVLVGSRQ
jgi:hypothetical protein